MYYERLLEELTDRGVVAEFIHGVDGGVVVCLGDAERCLLDRDGLTVHAHGGIVVDGLQEQCECGADIGIVLRDVENQFAVFEHGLERLAERVVTDILDGRPGRLEVSDGVGGAGGKHALHACGGGEVRDGRFRGGVTLQEGVTARLREDLILVALEFGKVDAEVLLELRRDGLLVLLGTEKVNG